MPPLLNSPYLVPIITFLGIIALYLFVGEISQIFVVLILIAAGTIYGLVFSNRWVVALFAFFLYFFIGFELQTIFSGSHVMSAVVVFLLSFLIYLCYGDEVYSVRGIVIALAFSVALLQSFLVLLFWPINLITKSVILTMISFLLLELIDGAHPRSAGRLPQGAILREVPWRRIRTEIIISVLIFAGIVGSSDWFMF